MQPILEEQKPSLHICCQFFHRECERTELYIYEFNFVSRNIGKIGKIDLLKNDL